MQGIVEFFNGRYGFIKPLAGGGADAKSIYFSVHAIARPEKGWIPGIPPGAEVSFDLVRSDRGPQCASSEGGVSFSERSKKAKSGVRMIRGSPFECPGFGLPV